MLGLQDFYKDKYMFTKIDNKEIWNTCLDLAIEGFNKGSMAIASVITDSNWKIIGKGRNCLGENNPDMISNSSVAHAEINAIDNIKVESLIGNGLKIFTTVEPCPMCLGAIAMSKVREVYIGSKDPHAGSLKYLNDNEYIKNKNITYKFSEGIIERVFFSIHYLSIKRAMKDRKDHIVFRNMRSIYSKEIEYIEKQIENDDIQTIKLSRDYIEWLNCN